MEKYSFKKIQNNDTKDYKESEELIDKENIPVSEKERDNIKKIDIPGFKEVEYTEKVINFPKHIIEETGGVEGYIKKTISWDELLKFWNISADDWEKMEKGHYLFSKKDAEERNKITKNMGGSNFYKEDKIKKLPSEKSVKNFKQAKGIELIIKELTNNEFIGQTMNHVINRGVAIKDETFGKDKMLEEIKITDYERIYDTKTNKLLFAQDYKRTFDNMTVEGNAKREKIKNKVKENNDTYSQSNFGFNLTNPEKFWRGYNFEGYYYSDSPSVKHIVLGFKINTHNTALRKYCEEVKKLLGIQKKMKKENFISRTESVHDIQAIETIEALLSPLEEEEDFGRVFPPNASDKLKSAAKYNVIAGLQGEGKHPRIPIVKNHPKIKELRLCHADYALISTKKGINILEMITTQNSEEESV